MSDSAPDTHPDGARRVLIVDDEATIRQALTRFYQRRGWVVTQAEDGVARVRAPDRRLRSRSTS